MVFNDTYVFLKDGIERHGGFTTLRHEDFGRCRLVCASQELLNRSLGGNSFLIWKCPKTERWYLSTWAPSHYMIPSSINLVDFCLKCLSLSKRAISNLPNEIIKQYNLLELSNSDFDVMYNGKEDGAES